MYDLITVSMYDFYNDFEHSFSCMMTISTSKLKNRNKIINNIVVAFVVRNQCECKLLSTHLYSDV